MLLHDTPYYRTPSQTDQMRVTSKAGSSVTVLEDTHPQAGDRIASIDVIKNAAGDALYLRSAPDSVPENNLDNLPPCAAMPGPP